MIAAHNKCLNGLIEDICRHQVKRCALRLIAEDKDKSLRSLWEDETLQEICSQEELWAAVAAGEEAEVSPRTAAVTAVAGAAVPPPTFIGLQAVVELHLGHVQGGGEGSCDDGGEGGTTAAAMSGLLFALRRRALPRTPVWAVELAAAAEGTAGRPGAGAGAVPGRPPPFAAERASFCGRAAAADSGSPGRLSRAV